MKIHEVDILDWLDDNPSFIKVSLNGERFWVRSVKQLKGKYVGIVDNILIINTDISLGSKFFFKETLSKG